MGFKLLLLAVVLEVIAAGVLPSRLDSTGLRDCLTMPLGRGTANVHEGPPMGGPS
jgi:hypothetical protein